MSCLYVRVCSPSSLRRIDQEFHRAILSLSWYYAAPELCPVPFFSPGRSKCAGSSVIDTRSMSVGCPPAIVPLTDMFPHLPALTHLAVACSAANHTENQLLVTVTSEPAGVSTVIWQSPSAGVHVSFSNCKSLLESRSDCNERRHTRPQSER